MGTNWTVSLPHMVLLCFMLIILTGCGGSGDDDFPFFPLWVETDVVVTDIDGDGRNDVITLSMLSMSMSHQEGRLLVYRQASPGVFAVPDTYVVGLYPWKLVVGDVDVDGHLDLLVTDPDGRCVWLLIQDRLNRGVFLPPQQVAGGIYTYEAAIADLNGDSRPDVAVAGSFPVGSPSKIKSRVNLFMQSGGGALAFAGFYEMPIPVTRVAAGDIDGDGLNDLVVLGYENQCLVMIQSHTSPGTFNAPSPLL